MSRTTTVQYGSITEAKLAQDVLADLAEIPELKEAITWLEGRYEVSSHGRVRNAITGELLCPRFLPNKYGGSKAEER